MCLVIFHNNVFVPLNPQKKAVNIINKVWELYLPYPIVRLLALPSERIKQ